MRSSKDCKVLFNTLIQRMRRNSQDDPIVDKPFYAIEDVISFIILIRKSNKIQHTSSRLYIQIDQRGT